MSIASIVIACFALILAVVIFIRDNNRYRIPLQLRTPYCWVSWSKDNLCLVLFRLWFVNHALSGRSVARVLITPPNGITEIQYAWVYDEDYKNASVRLPNSEQTSPLPISEVLHDVLDIPPHQSQCKWVGFLLGLPQKKDAEMEEKEVAISFAALDVNDKFLAVLQIPMTLAKLRTVGIYNIPMMRVFERYKVHKRF